MKYLWDWALWGKLVWTIINTKTGIPIIVSLSKCKLSVFLVVPSFLTNCNSDANLMLIWWCTFRVHLGLSLFSSWCFFDVIKQHNHVEWWGCQTYTISPPCLRRQLGERHLLIGSFCYFLSSQLSFSILISVHFSTHWLSFLSFQLINFHSSNLLFYLSWKPSFLSSMAYLVPHIEFHSLVHQFIISNINISHVTVYFHGFHYLTSCLDQFSSLHQCSFSNYFFTFIVYTIWHHV